MNRFIASALLACACMGSASAHASEAASMETTDVAAIKQLGQDMGDAMVARDVDRLGQIFADEWVSLASNGKVVTKEGFLHDFKLGKHQLETFELGPMDVQVFGNVAVVHGSVTETRSVNGQENSGRFLYMDLMERRAGRWVVVQSAGARVK